jgi:hypothetical protein
MSALRWSDLALTTAPGLPEFFLGRLASLVARQAAAASPAERTALAWAAFSVYLDCLDLGLDREARQLIAQRHTESAAPERVAA